MKEIFIVHVCSSGIDCNSIELGKGDAFVAEIYEKTKQDVFKPFEKHYAYYVRGRLELPLDKNSASFKYVMERCKEISYKPEVCQKYYYTDSEMEKVEYFQMNIHNSFELAGVDNEDFGTQYESGCPNPKCRIGKRLVGDVLADRKLLKKRDIGLMIPGIFISEKLKDLICENSLTGVSFDHEVKDYKEREMARMYVLDIINTLPPMASSTWLFIEDRNTFIDECGHHNPYLRSDIQYEREKLKDAKDFNLSSEYLHGLRKYQEIIVSAKARKLFMQNKIRAGFFPVAVL